MFERGRRCTASTYSTIKQLNKILTPYDLLHILIDCGCAATRGLLLVILIYFLIHFASDHFSSDSVLICAIISFWFTKITPRCTMQFWRYRAPMRGHWYTWNDSGFSCHLSSSHPGSKLFVLEKDGVKNRVQQVAWWIPQTLTTKVSIQAVTIVVSLVIQ